MAMLQSHRVTASFGVTEIQPGDTAGTMLRRADRALLRAKEAGRNRVVHIGNGMVETQPAKEQRRSRSWWSWFRTEIAPTWTEARSFVTRVPLDLAIEKLRGFVSDHQGTIVRIDGNVVAIKVDSTKSAPGRRQSDCPIPLAVELRFQEMDGDSKPLPMGATVATQIDVRIEPIRVRDRRQAEFTEQVFRLTSSLKAYFIAELLPDTSPARGSDESSAQNASVGLDKVDGSHSS
jgi:hypothetical protein